MRRSCVAAMRAGFRATCLMMDAAKKPPGPPIPHPTTKVLRAIWTPQANNCDIKNLCRVCHSVAAKDTRGIPIEMDIYNSFQSFMPPIVVASAIMGMLDQRVPVPKVNAAEVFECLNILDSLGEEDRVAMERGMYELLYDSTDPNAAVLAFFVHPAGPRRRAAPVVGKFLESLITNCVKKADAPPDDDTAENAALKSYLRAFTLDEESVRAVFSLIRGVPARYRNRCDILFAMRLETLLTACAHEVWPEGLDATTKAYIDEVLKNMRSKPDDDAASVQAAPQAASPLEEVTFEKLRDRDDWHTGFTKTLNTTGTRVILKSEEKTIDGKPKYAYKIMPEDDDDADGRIVYIRRFDEGNHEPITIKNFTHLSQILRGAVKVPELKPFNPSSVLMSEIEFNAGIQDELFPEMSGVVVRDKDFFPCMEQQLFKRHCTLVNGASGTGKTVFSTTMLPRAMYQNALVLHYTIKKEDEAPLAEIARLDKDYHDDILTNKRKQMQHLFASCALRRRREATPYADAADYPGWMEACSTILGANLRNQMAKKYVVNVLKELLENDNDGNDNEWVKRTKDVERYPNTVFLVLDELGKCLALARAVISAQYSIYMDAWVCNHFAKLELVLCGTGTEMALSSSSWSIATDPTSVNVLTLLKPNPRLLEAAFLRSLIGTSSADSAAKTKAQSLFPLIYAQYNSSTLFNDAKTNTRLYLQSCYFLKLIIRSLSKSGYDDDDLYKKHAARMDSCFARALGLDGCVRLAIPWFICCNGLGRVREEEDRLAVDAALTRALQRVRPLLPLPPLHEDEARMGKASTLGLIVRRSGEMPSAALTAVITFGYTEPCAATEGYTQEQFTAEWASRLVEVQTGYAAPIVSLPFCLPWKDRVPPSSADVASLLVQLCEHKALVLLNGPSAPGPDVMVVQLRRPYAEVEKRMSRETYDKLYPDGVAAIVTVISNKQRSKDMLQQALTLGVVNIEDLLASLGAAKLEEAWCEACSGERKARERNVELSGELDVVFNPSIVAEESQIKPYLKCIADYSSCLSYLSNISSVYKRIQGSKTDTEGSKNDTEGSKTDTEEADTRSLLNMVRGLKKDDYHYAGPLFLGLLCARALKLATEKVDGTLTDLLSEGPDKLEDKTGVRLTEFISEDPAKLRAALEAALQDTPLVAAVQGMCGTKSPARVLVRPCFVSGNDPGQGDIKEYWRKSVLSGDAFSWACAGDSAEWAVGPVEKMIRVESKGKNDN